MEKKSNKGALKLLREIDCMDRETLELKKEFQHNGCPFCEVDDGQVIEDYQTAQALFYKFKKCNSCSLIYPSTRPNKDILENFFISEDFSRESELKLKKGLFLEKMKNERDRKRPFLSRIIRSACRSAWRNSPLCYSFKEFTRYTKKGHKVLDVGAGDGVVAQMLINKGCKVDAVELNSYRAKYLRERLGIKVYESRFEEAEIPEASYDRVIFSQVLMHLFSLKGAIQKVRHLLKPGGLLVSSQTNFNAIIQKTIRSPYPGGNLTPFSLCSWFTPESLRKILEKSGFQVIDVMIRPTGLLGYLFVEGYPKARLDRLMLMFADEIIKIALMRTKTSDYFSIIARRQE